MATYKIKAHVQVLGIIDEFDTEIIHKSNDYVHRAINDAKVKIHKKYNNGDGSKVIIKETIIIH